MSKTRQRNKVSLRFISLSRFTLGLFTKKETKLKLWGKRFFLVSDEPDPALDPYELANPLSITTCLPPDFYSHLSSSKWKDRKELALEPLLSLLSQSIKYDPSSNYTELVSALAGRMGDANVLCVVLAANALEKLARGLRGGFAGYKGMSTKELLGRTKEKKQNVLDALGNALDAVYLSVSITLSLSCLGSLGSS